MVALFDTPPQAPIIGAEFGIEGISRGANWAIDVGPASNETGRVLRPPTPSQVLLSFYDVIPVSGNVLPLAKVYILAYSNPGPTRVSIVTSSPPTNPAYQTPVLILEHQEPEVCGGGSPRYETVPMTGLFAMINGPCSVGIESTTWSRVKTLFK